MRMANERKPGGDWPESPSTLGVEIGCPQSITRPLIGGTILAARQRRGPRYYLPKDAVNDPKAAGNSAET